MVAIVTFEPPVSPSADLQNKPEFKLLESEFGDGYTQASPDGLNHIRQVVSLRFELLEKIDRDTIISFLMSHGGTKPFFYRIPTDDYSLPYTCKEWDWVALGAGLFNITATFREYFGPVA